MDKKLTIACLLLLALILTSCSGSQQPTASITPAISPSAMMPTPSASAAAITPTPVPIPSAAQTPAVTEPATSEEIKLTKSAVQAYMKNISDILATQSNYKGTFSEDSIEEDYCGCLYDLDNDGQSELIMAFPVDNEHYKMAYFYYEVYSFKSDSSVLLKREKLFSSAGGPEGGLRIVNYNSKRYLCTWDEDSHSAAPSILMMYNYTLFTYDGSDLKQSYLFNFSYLSNKNGLEPLFDRPGLFKDGAEISFDEFLLTKKAFDNPVTELCRVGKREPPKRLKQLYKDLETYCSK